MQTCAVDKLLKADYTDKEREENGDEEMIYCCEEHVDLALDEVVGEHEIAPKFEKLESVENIQNSCGYCGKPAVYMVANE
ncbi:MAG: CxxH/CxxC protein [Bacillota bacterium]